MHGHLLREERAARRALLVAVGAGAHVAVDAEDVRRGHGLEIALQGADPDRNARGVELLLELLCRDEAALRNAGEDLDEHHGFIQSGGFARHVLLR